jgi:hypothetical protein
LAFVLVEILANVEQALEMVRLAALPVCAEDRTG